MLASGVTVSDHDDLERDLRLLETSLRKLESQYQMFFSGQLPKPPLETRGRVESLLRRYDRAYIQSYEDRFRLSTLQTRFVRFSELWDRALRAREEGRPGPFHVGRRSSDPPADAVRTGQRATERAEVPGVEPTPAVPPPETVVKVPLGDPAGEEEKLTVLYRSLLEARRAVGNEDNLPFDSFARLVKGQLSSLRRAGSGEVAFRIAVKDGKVTFTAKVVKAQGARVGEE
jgi:hypothetical protein